MLKFRCQHCGQRIAVPARHLGKLVTCAECGRATHPLAQEIERAREAAEPTPRRGATAAVAEPPPAPAAASSACANCGAAVGRLQASHLWEGQRVCGPCHRALSSESSLEQRTDPVLATRVRSGARSDAPLEAPATPGVREQLVRGLVVFVVGVVALYGALTLLRDLAGLIAVAAVAVLALLALYGVFRAKWPGRVRQRGDTSEAALVAVRGK